MLYLQFLNLQFVTKDSSICVQAHNEYAMYRSIDALQILLTCYSLVIHSFRIVYSLSRLPL
jgi:hypothetical protein